METQFPELSWNLGSIVSSCVEHGLMLRNRGHWNIPDYQRGLVWTDEQNVSFMESLILGLPIGQYTLHQDRKCNHEVLDGQQRWNAIFEYVDNKYPVFGLYYNDLNEVSKMHLMMTQFAHRLVKNLTYKQRVEAYTRMAYGGTPHEVPQST